MSLNGFFLLCCFISYAAAQSLGTTLTQVIVQPCNYSYAFNVSQDYSYVFELQAYNLTECKVSNLTGIGAFRVQTTIPSTSSVSDPAVFTARQDTGVVSWTIPLQPQGFSAYFFTVQRTLCSLYFPVNESTRPAIYVDVFSSSEEPINFTIDFTPVEDFTLSLGDDHSFIVGASTPLIYYFQFPDGHDSVTVQATSESDLCAIVSVQNKSCPANDLLDNAFYKGQYQTMSGSAFLTIRENQVNNREFLLVMIMTNYSVCHRDKRRYNDHHDGNITNLEPPLKLITVRVDITPSFSKYVGAILYPVVFFIGVIVISLMVVFTCLPCLYVKLLFLNFCNNKSCKCAFCCPPNKDWVDWTNPRPLSQWFCCPPEPKGRENGDEEENLLEDSTGTNGRRVHTRRVPPSSRQGDDIMELEDYNNEKLPSMCKGMFQTNAKAKEKMETLEKEYGVYSWNTITVGIFYALPAFQLLISQQLLLDVSGDQDRCYYNFQCAHPLGVLSAFNSLWSNIGFVLLGIGFIVIVICRQLRYRRIRNNSLGVPQMFGIYYAMGFGLILEGFMSAFYHICPSNANFQFDTAFMFIIGGLLLLKIFQSRHPDINASAVIAFFVFAIVLVFTLLGMRFDDDNHLAVRLSLLLVGLFLLITFLISFYHFHDWKVDFVKLKEKLKKLTKFTGWSPNLKVRCFRFSFVVFLSIAIAVITVIAVHQVSVPTAILTFFLTYFFYFLTWYILLKFLWGEPWTILPLILPFVSVALFVASLVFYFHNVSDWELTPAESRELNHDCVLFGFYDYHDVWHFLSACGLFTGFLFVLTIDDGLEKTERKEINVF